MSNTTDQWADDKLGRKQDAKFLYNFLIGQVEKRKAQGRTASYVLNVDAEWGGGKSFFLDGLAQDIESRGHLVARVNAWRDDHAQDPYIAIMSAIDETFEPFAKKPGKIAKAWTATKTSGGAIALKVGGAVLKGFIKKHAGVSVDEISDLIGEGLTNAELVSVMADGGEAASEQLEKLFDASLQAMIDGFKRTDHAMEDFGLKLENAISEASASKTFPLFILVDELDRCRPTYAVQLLERVKHLFDVEGVVFVFATNTAQLQHSISGAYGAGFDGFRYLKRFFDRTYTFGEPSTEALIESLCERLPADKISAPEGNLVQALVSGCSAYNLDLRAIIQVIEMIDASATAWSFAPVKADILFLFPLCASFYKTGRAEWPAATSGEIDRWLVPRTRIRRGTTESVDFSVYYNRAYRQGVHIFGDIDAMLGVDTSDRRDPATLHLADIFRDEWNFRKYVEGNTSVQANLLGLVANAGRMSSQFADS